jgi:adenylate cyclase
MGGRVKGPDIARYGPPLVAGLAAACVIGLIHLALPTYLKELDLQISDRMHQLRLQIHGPLRQDPRLIHVNVDDSSVSALGRVPWPRGLVAQVVDTVRDLGAHAIVFDVLFPYPTSPKIDPQNENDRAFAQALSAIGNAYLASALDLTRSLQAETQQEEDLKREMVYPTELLRRHTAPAPVPLPFDLYYGKTRFLPMEAFAQVVRGIGHISRTADSDGGVRRNPLVVQVKDRLFPALSFRIAVDLLDSDLAKVELHPGAVIVRDALLPGEAARKNLRIPVDKHGQMTVSFANLWDQAFMHISAAELLEEAEDPEKRPELERKFKGAVVVYAVSTTGTSDTGTVPLESAYPLNGVHMNMINTILTQQFLVESGPYTVLYLVLGMAIGVALLSLWLQPYIYLIVAILTIAGYVAVGWVGFNEFGRILPIAPVVLVGVLSSAGMLTYRYAAGEREKQKTRAAFAPYFAPAVVEMLLSDSARLMGGQRKELTILFSDVVEFTSLCEGVEPEVVQKVLQEYFNEMTRIGFGHQGTLDKFIGDGMLWFFGDPLPQADHALRAVHTALDMQAAMHPLREKWKQEGRPELAMRIGVNTGVVLVGNMGSDARMEYTVMGDAVNLASRVEGANKPFHTEVMMTERTYEMVKDTVEWRELDLLRVKGKKQGVRVYEVMAARKGELSDVRRQVLAVYNEGLEAYKRRDWSTAIAAFTRALSIDKTDGPSQLYLERAEEFLKNPPPADWDGVYEMKTK